MSGWETYYKTEGEEEEEEEESPDPGGKLLHQVVWSAWKKDFSCLLFFFLLEAFCCLIALPFLPR